MPASCLAVTPYTAETLWTTNSKIFSMTRITFCHLYFSKIVFGVIYLLTCLTSNCQTFSTEFYLENELGEKDTIRIGYDEFATNGEDPEYGEEAIWEASDFSVLVGNTNNIGIDCVFLDPIEDGFSYLGKTNIISGECLGENSLLSSMAILIPISSPIVQFTWRPIDFNNDCLFYSEAFNHTPEPLDVGCCVGDVISLAGEEELATESIKTRLDGCDEAGLNYDSYFYTQTGDTLIARYLRLRGTQPSSIEEIELGSETILYPNPTSSTLFITNNQNWEVNNIFDFSGKLVEYTDKDGEIHLKESGVFFIKLTHPQFGQQTVKIIKL